MIHHLKIKQEYYEAVISGRKPFEIRNNDRNFHIGDLVHLEEFLGIKETPICADINNCEAIRDDEQYCPLARRMCTSYTEDIYSGRRCSVIIKEIFDLSSAGFEGCVAFTFDIRNIRDKKPTV